MKSRRNINHFLSRLSVVLCLLLFFLCSCSSQPPKESLSLTILHTNDHHGHALSYTHNQRHIGGLAERMTLIKRLKEQARSTGDMFLLFDAGDISSGTLFSDFFSAEPDWKIAVIGVSHPDTPIISTLGNEERLEFRSAIDATALYVQELRKTHDLIIVLSHLGEDEKLAKAVKGIDLIIGGHFHSPLETPKKKNKTLLVNAGYGGEYVGQMRLLLERGQKGVKVSQLDYELLAVTGDLQPDEEILSILQPYSQTFGDRGQTIIEEAGDIFLRDPLADSWSSSVLANLVADSYRLCD